MDKHIVGVFRDRQSAINSIQQLKMQGYDANDITVISNNESLLSDLHRETMVNTDESSSMGSSSTSSSSMDHSTEKKGFFEKIKDTLTGDLGDSDRSTYSSSHSSVRPSGWSNSNGTWMERLTGLGFGQNETDEYSRYVESGNIVVAVEDHPDRGHSIRDMFSTHGSLNASSYGSVGFGGMSDTASSRSDYVANDMGTGLNDGSPLVSSDSDVRSDTYSDSYTTSASDMRSDSMAGTTYSEGLDTDRSVTMNNDLTRTDRIYDNDMDQDEGTIRLREEQLNVDKTRVQAGEVTLRKEIIEEQQTIQVPVTHEEIVIERRAVTDGVGDSTPIGTEEVIRIPVSEEQVHITKSQVVTGEVAIGKREVQEMQQVKDTVRREEVRLDQDGNPIIADDASLVDDLDRIDSKDSTSRRL